MIDLGVWIYQQSTGFLWDNSGEKAATCYSGKGDGKNNPRKQSIAFVGPIPRGLYAIGEAFYSDNLGPHVLPLQPLDHDCLGRDDFCCHGDSRYDPGNASEGCLIAPPNIRKQMKGLLMVVE